MVYHFTSYYWLFRTEYHLPGSTLFHVKSGGAWCNKPEASGNRIGTETIKTEPNPWGIGTGRNRKPSKTEPTRAGKRRTGKRSGDKIRPSPDKWGKGKHTNARKTNRYIRAVTNTWKGNGHYSQRKTTGKNEGHRKQETKGKGKERTGCWWLFQSFHRALHQKVLWLDVLVPAKSGSKHLFKGKARKTKGTSNVPWQGKSTNRNNMN